MQNFRTLLSFVSAMILVLPFAHAQSTTDAASESTENQAGGQQLRPEMPNLFYRKEQRRVLEAVRQGVVREEDFDIQGFVPVVILEEVVEEVAEAGENLSRKQDIYFDAYILNKSTGKGLLWINGREVQLGEDKDTLAREGIVVAESEEEKREFYEGVLRGSDAYSNSGFKIRVGQVLSTDGFVEETLPVIVKKN